MGGSRRGPDVTKTVLGGVALAAMVGSVLVIDPAGLAPFGPARFAAVSTATLAALALALRSGGSLARGPMLAWSVFLVLVALAAALGLDPLYAWTGTPERHFGVLTWGLCLVGFVAGQLLGRRGARLVIPAVLATVGLVGLWTLAEVLGWRPLDVVASGDRPVASLGSSAFLGAAMALLAPTALGLVFDADQPARRRWSAGLAGGLGLVALVASGARAAWVGALVGNVVVLLLRRRLRHPPAAALPLPARALAPGLVLAAVAVVAIAVLTGTAGRVPDAFGDGRGGIGGRLDEWRVAIRVVAANPLTGVGPEGYRIAFGAHVDDTYEMEHGRDPLPDRAHSAVLDVAATVGLPGVAAYLVLLGIVGRYVVRAIRRGPSWLAGLAAGFVGYAVQSVFLFPLAELDPLAWMLAGVVVALVPARHDALAPEGTPPSGVALPDAGASSTADTSAAKGAPTVERAPSSFVEEAPPIDGERAARLDGPATLVVLPVRVVPLVVGVLAIVALAAGGLDVAADRRARRTLQALATPAPVTQSTTPPSELRPDALRYHLVDARVHEALGSVAGLEAAIGDLDQALDVSPLDPVARAERARLLLEHARRTEDGADLTRARQVLEALAQDDPRNAEVLLRLGLARTLTGDEAGAEVAWLTAERLAPRSGAASTNLAVAYARAGRRAEAVAAAERALVRDPVNQRAAAVLEDLGT